jgi:RNA-directed DNA polymerase
VRFPRPTLRNIYVKSLRAGERVKDSLSRFITDRLKLKVNEAKSAVYVPHKRQFLGFSFTAGKLANRRKIAPQSLRRFRARVRHLTRRNRGLSQVEQVRRLKPYLIGWRGYFGLCETASVLRDLDSWIRHRLRCVQWKQWKVYRRRKAELIRLGVNPKLAHTTAWSAKGPWRVSHTPGVRMALHTGYFDALGLPRLEPRVNI